MNDNNDVSLALHDGFDTMVEAIEKVDAYMCTVTAKHAAFDCRMKKPANAAHELLTYKDATSQFAFELIVKEYEKARHGDRSMPVFFCNLLSTDHCTRKSYYQCRAH